MAAVSRAFVVAVALLATIFELAMAANLDVSWDLTTNYAKLASSMTFQVGDTILFKYTSVMHDVSEVSSSDYSSCTSTNPLSTGTGGSTVVTLKTVGKRYFICSKLGHCQGGMKLAIDVVAASSPTPAPSPAPANVSSPSLLSPAAAPVPSSPAAAPPQESDSSAHTHSPPAPSGAAKEVTLGFSFGMMIMLLLVAL